MRSILFFCTLLLVFSVQSAYTADVKEKFPVQQSLEYKGAKDLFPGDISFFWGQQTHPAVETNYGTFKASKRTNALGKARGDACAWAMASALEALQQRARREGGNAIINIVSNIKNVEESSETSFSCLAGSMMVNVALKGTVVKLSK